MRRSLLALLGVLVVLAAGFAVVAWHPDIAPVAPPSRSAFDPALVRRGAELASLGYCASCHTAADGRAYGGGRPLATPFGTIYGTNISPDPDSGIGRWSLAAFRRAMREGLDRAGHNLYPAFPYDHFTRLSDDDIGALYAFLMTRDPAHADTPPNALPFPYNLRPLLAGWNLLFLKEGPFSPDPAKDALWNRGAYLAEGPSHCGGCHTPRNSLGAEQASRAFDGGEAEGWWAPPLNATSPAPVPWTEDDLFTYLRAWDPRHGGAAGPMAAVADDLAQVPEADIRAIAHYIASLMGPPSTERLKQAEALAARPPPDTTHDPDLAAGAAIYDGLCAVCHESAGQVPFTLRSLAQHTALAAPDPRNVLQAIRGGIRPPEGEAGPIMPAFAGVLSDKQTADLLRYLRARFSDRPPWSDVGGWVARSGGAGS